MGFFTFPGKKEIKSPKTILARNMHHVFVDEKWVVAKYMEHEHRKDSDKLDNKSDLLVIELEQQLQDEALGIATVGLNLHEEDSDEDVEEEICLA